MATREWTDAINEAEAINLLLRMKASYLSWPTGGRPANAQ
jgi:hypothetical protein